MSETEISIKELLLSNLSDHRVVSVDGSLDWYDQLYQSLNQLQNTSLVKLEGSLHFAEVEMRISAAISANTDMAVIWLDPHEADEKVCPYLLQLVNEEYSKPVVFVLVNSLRLDAFLAELPTAIPIDGYYQEEVIKAAQVTSSGMSPMLVGSVLCVVCVVGGGLWYLSGSDKEANPSLGTTYSQEQVVEPVNKVVYAWEKPKEELKADSQSNLKVEPKTELKLVDVPVELVAKPQAAPDVSIIKKQEFEVVTDKPPQALSATRMLEEFSAALGGATTIPVEKKEELVSKSASHKHLKTPDKGADKAALPSGSENTPPKVTDEISSIKPLVEQVAVSEPAEQEEPLRVNKSSSAPLVTEFVLKKGLDILSRKEQEDIISVIDRWARAWSAQDWENYIDSYIEGKPYGIKVSLKEWRAFRKDRLVSPEWVLLKFGKPSLTVYDPHWVKVELYQRFEKPGYADETIKRLELKRTLNGWKIASEATDGTVVLSR